MKRKSFLFAVVLVTIVSLVPLSGVSAQRPAPASSASMAAASAPAARAIYSKQIKTQLIMYCGPLQPCFKFVQKLYWEYGYRHILSWSTTHREVVYQPKRVHYAAYGKLSSGGVGYRYYYQRTSGAFLFKEDYAAVSIIIEQEVYGDGTYWTNKWCQLV